MNQIMIFLIFKMYQMKKTNMLVFVCIHTVIYLDGQFGYDTIAHTPIQESLRWKKCTVEKTSFGHITLPCRFKKYTFENILTGKKLSLIQIVE